MRPASLRRPAGATGLAVLGAALAVPSPARAEEPRWRVEAGLGGSLSFGSALRLEQRGQPPIEVDAEWEARSLEPPLYYGVRVSRDEGGGAWGLRFVHHKIHLANPTAEVERFSVSHGYNQLSLERGFPVRGVKLWLGAGLVVAHPESTVRGRTGAESGGSLGGGYHLTGPLATIAASRAVPLGRGFALVPEARFTLSRARVPIADGEASFPNVALHALVGLELAF